MPAVWPVTSGFIRLGQLELARNGHKLELPAILPIQKRRHLLLTFPPSQAAWAQEYFNVLIVRLLASAESESESWIKPVLGRSDSYDSFLQSLERIADSRQRKASLQMTSLEVAQLASDSQRSQRLSQRISERRIIVIYRLATNPAAPDSIAVPLTHQAVQIVESIIDALDTGSLLLGIQSPMDQWPESLSALADLPVFEHLAVPTQASEPWRLRSASEWQDRGMIESYHFVPDEHPAGQALITRLASLTG